MLTNGLLFVLCIVTIVGMDNIEKHEYELKKYLLDELKDIPNVITYNKNSRSGILAFNIEGVFAQESSIYLNHYHIYVRAGNHCSKMLKDEINIKNTVRVSMYFYNTKEEISFKNKLALTIVASSTTNISQSNGLSTLYKNCSSIDCD